MIASKVLERAVMFVVGGMVGNSRNASKWLIDFGNDSDSRHRSKILYPFTDQHRVALAFENVTKLNRTSTKEDAIAREGAVFDFVASKYSRIFTATH